MLNGWSYRIQLTINSSSVGAAYSDFPIYLNMELLPSAFFTYVKTNGSDIRITTSDGDTEVPIEISTIDTINRRGKLYFKGNVSNSSNTTYYIYYGNASATAYAPTHILGRNAVWSNQFLPQAVYHLDGHSTTIIQDSTQYGRSMTINNNILPVYNAGNGNVLEFDGATQWAGYQGAIIDRTTDYSISTYLYSRTTTAARQAFVGLWGTMDGGKTRKLATSGYFEASEYDGTNRNVTSTVAPTNNTWTHFVSTKSFSNVRRRIYMAGSLHLEVSQATSPNAITTGYNAIGARTISSGETFSLSEYANMLASEVRIYNTELPAGWILSEYNNLTNTSSFVSIGSVEPIVVVTAPTVETLSPNVTSTSATFRGRLISVGDYTDVKGYFKYRPRNLVSPYTTTTYSHKVQLHAHTTQSDGEIDPIPMITMYQNEGFVAVAKSDHDTYGGSNLSDPGGHSIIHIPATEYSSGNHLGAIGITSYNNRNANQRQLQINDTNTQGGLSVIHHPHSGWDNASIMALSNFGFVELWNARYANAEDVYDYVLTQGRKVLCTASDDFHSSVSGHQFRGWVVINSNISAGSLTYQDILTCIKSGNYYCVGRALNTHPYPPAINVSCIGATINVLVDKASKIEFIKQNGTIAKTTNNTTNTFYDFGETDTYIRVKATYNDGTNDSWAWSNPIYPETQAWIETQKQNIPNSDYIFTFLLNGQTIGNTGDVQAFASYNSDLNNVSGTVLPYLVENVIIDITITVSSESKIYGEAINLSDNWSITSGSLQVVDDITGIELISSGASTAAAVGTYPITVGTVYGNGVEKYNITYVLGNVTVNQKALAVTAANKTISYNAAIPTLTVTYSGFVNGDTDVVLNNTAFNLATTYTQGAAAGTYPITIGIGSASDNNYTFTPLTGGTITVNESVPSVSVPVGSKWILNIIGV